MSKILNGDTIKDIGFLKSCNGTRVIIYEFFQIEFYNVLKIIIRKNMCLIVSIKILLSRLLVEYTGIT